MAVGMRFYELVRKELLFRENFSCKKNFSKFSNLNQRDEILFYFNVLSYPT